MNKMVVKFYFLLKQNLKIIIIKPIEDLAVPLLHEQY